MISFVIKQARGGHWKKGEKKEMEWKDEIGSYVPKTPFRFDF